MQRAATLALLTLLAACSREPRAHKADTTPSDVADVADVAAPPPARTTPIAAATLPPVSPDLQLLSADDHLVRVALVLAGRRPTDAEFAAVRRDPAALGGIVDAWLDAPTFGAVVRDLWHEVLLLRTEGKYVLPRLGDLPQGTDGEWIRDVSEEPLRLIEHVVMHDRPFGEIVTSEFAIASDLGLQVWGGTRLPPGADAPPDGWHKVTWDSGQPMAGVLSSGALWLRYPSNGTNLHRGQAELLADAFLCSGFLGRDVPLFNNIDLSDEEVVKQALTREPGCVSCHQTLDPLASHLFAIQRVGANTVKKAYDKADPTKCINPDRCYPLTEWRPKQAGTWQKRTGRPPGYFGLPSGDLPSLGAQIAADPRFSMCVARRFYGYLLQVDPDRIPDPTAAALQDALIAADMRIKPLVKAIVLSADFRAAGVASDGPAAALVGRKTTRPEQLGRLIADLTGFVWTATPGGAGKNGKPGKANQRKRFGEVSLLDTDFFGYRALAGGVEGNQITEPSFAYSPTRTLVLQALAAEAAAHAVAAGELLTIPAGATADDAVRAQLVALHTRLLAEPLPADAPAVDAGLALFKSGLGPKGKDTARAWTLVLTALLQDPRVAFH